MKRRDFAIGLFLAAATQSSWAQEPARPHRIAIVIPSGPVARISETGGGRFYQAIFDELRRLGEIEGQNITVDRFSGEGRPEGFVDLARQVVSRNPQVIVAMTDPIAQAVHAVSGTIPIEWIGGDPILAGLTTSLARPGGNVTGVTVYVGHEIWGKRLQILKEAAPSASKIAFLEMRTDWAANERQLREAGGRLEVSVIVMMLQESTPSEYRRVFSEIAQERPEAIVVSSDGTLVPYRQLIVELVEKSRLPAIYGWRDYVEAGALMSYGADQRELGRRLADDVHQILNGTKPGDIPIYQPTKFEFLINLKAAKAIGITIPPALLATADEVIE
ncbi:MAG: ABC transporter substrate-binding protein [Alphaproteobacteria bacterium]|nr:ABC transporter substrate-binding protein [Alphaproteobacteria bacterium]